MSDVEEFKFEKTIDATRQNAEAIQRLTLQDVIAGGFRNPRELADPDNPELVTRQQSRLNNHPERYSGYTRNGELVAYMKQNEWTLPDELPFSGIVHRVALKLRKELNLDMGSWTGEWGVFGLVAADSLAAWESNQLLLNLLRRTYFDAKGQPQVVNIVLHDNDPLNGHIRREGFVVKGKPGQAAGAPGLEQLRYRRPASFV